MNRETMMDMLKEYDRLAPKEHYDDMLEPAGAKFRITMDQFKTVRAVAIQRCKYPISERRRIGEAIIDDLEAGRVTIEDLEKEL